MQASYFLALEVGNRVDENGLPVIVSLLDSILQIHLTLRESIRQNFVQSSTSMSDVITGVLQDFMNIAQADLTDGGLQLIAWYKLCFNQEYDDINTLLSRNLFSCSQQLFIIQEMLQVKESPFDEQQNKYLNEVAETASELRRNLLILLPVINQPGNISNCSSIQSVSLCESAIYQLISTLENISIDLVCLNPQNNKSCSSNHTESSSVLDIISKLEVAEDMITNVSSCLQTQSSFEANFSQWLSTLSFEILQPNTDDIIANSLNVLDVDAISLQSWLDLYLNAEMTTAQLAEVFLGTPVATMLLDLDNTLSTIEQITIADLNTLTLNVELFLKQAYREMLEFLVLFQRTFPLAVGIEQLARNFLLWRQPSTEVTTKTVSMFVNS